MMNLTAMLVTAASAAALALAGGCHTLGRPGGEVSVRSLTGNTVLKPTLRTAAYKRIDANTADLYFSDLPEDRLIDASDRLEDAAGTILHVHYFLTPSAGSTPIDDTACNVTFKQVVFAPGPNVDPPANTNDPGSRPGQVVGVYGGGGFLFPSGTPGADIFGGSVRNGTFRLIGATPGFRDALGTSEIEGKMLAVQDDALADAMAAKMRALRRGVKDVQGQAVRSNP